MLQLPESWVCQAGADDSCAMPVLAGLSLRQAALLVAGCATPPEPQFMDADWVSHVTTGRGAYERGDYRRAAEAYGRAEQRAQALDDADALAVAAV